MVCWSAGVVPIVISHVVYPIIKIPKFTVRFSPPSDFYVWTGERRVVFLYYVQFFRRASACRQLRLAIRCDAHGTPDWPQGSRSPLKWELTLARSLRPINDRFHYVMVAVSFIRLDVYSWRQRARQIWNKSTRRPRFLLPMCTVITTLIADRETSLVLIWIRFVLKLIYFRFMHMIRRHEASISCYIKNIN